MATISHIGTHYLACCERDGLTEACREGSCPICSGGLSYCHICGGAEASLPTDCPGEWMTELRQDLVQEGVLDYRRAEGGWVPKSNVDSWKNRSKA